MSNNDHEKLDKRVGDCWQEFLNCPSWLPDSWHLLLNDLSDALYYHFRELGGIEYLEESINHVFKFQPIGDPNHSTTLNNLVTAVSTCFKQLGRMKDLEEAITCHHQALSLQPQGHPNCSYSLSNLVTDMSTHFKQLGRKDDLEEAITCHCQALALWPQGHPNYSSSLNNLATAMSTHFEQLGRIEDLEEAITCFSHIRKKVISFQCPFAPFLAFKSCERKLKSWWYIPFVFLLELETPFKR